MSPVSRGRKPKKKGGKAKAKSRPASARQSQASASGPGRDGPVFGESLSDEIDFFDYLDGFDESDDVFSPFDADEPPEWYDPAIDRILDQTEALLSANSPRELEQTVAGLVAAEMHRALNEEQPGLWFDRLVGELIDAAAVRITDDPGSSDPGWAASWRLLYGLSAIIMPGLQAVALQTIAQVRKALPAEAVASQPDWLTLLPKIAATGDVREMHDVYGTRFAVIAGYRYPGAVDEHQFLFDIDACGEIALAGGGVFDGLEQAAAAWREPLGEAAAGVVPTPVDSSERLLCLAYADEGQEYLDGDESQPLLENVLRMNRRIYELQKVLRKKRIPLPETESLFDDVLIEPEAGQFIDWYEQRHGVLPDLEAVEAVAEEWLEGALPGTSHSASPHRAGHRLILISDWQPDPVREHAKKLLPEWVRWNAEQSGLPEHLTERAVAAATHLGDTRPLPADG